MTKPFPGKRTEILPPVRVCEELDLALHDLAKADDRSQSDYIRRVLEKHCLDVASVTDLQVVGNKLCE